MVRKNAGFTLMEIMVVMVIMAIMIGVATMAIGDGGRAERFEQQARRLGIVLDQLSQEAVLKYQQFGVIFQKGGYSFVKLNEESGKWEELASSDKAFSPQEFGEGIELELEVEGMSTGILKDSTIEELEIIDDEELEKVDTGVEEEKDLTPQVFLYSSGEISDFELTIRQENTDGFYVIKGNISGSIEFLTSDDLEEEYD